MARRRWLLENLAPGVDPVACSLYCDDLRDLTENTPKKGVRGLLKTFRQYGFELGVKTEEYGEAGMAILTLGGSFASAVRDSWACQRSPERPSSAVPKPLARWMHQRGKSPGIAFGKWLPHSATSENISYRPTLKLTGNSWTLSVEDKLALAICLDLTDYMKAGRWSQLRHCTCYRVYSAKRTDVKSCGRASCVRISRW